MGVRIVETTVSDKIDSGGDLYALHQDEIGTRGYVADTETLRKAEEAGILLALVAYDGDTPVGYSVNVLGPDLGKGGALICSNHTLFVRRECRKGGTGLRLIRATEAAAKSRGASRMEMQAFRGTDAHRVYPSCGYVETYTTFAKELS